MRDRQYDDRQIVSLARRGGLKVIRPNGDTRIRGSRRLLVVDPNDRDARVYAFAAIEEDGPTKIRPVPLTVPGL